MHFSRTAPTFKLSILYFQNLKPAFSNRHHSVPTSIPCILYNEKQSPILKVLHIKRYSTANIDKIFRRSPIQKCDFINAAMQHYCSHTSAWIFSCKFAAYLQNTYFEEHLSRKQTACKYFTFIKCCFVNCSQIEMFFQ